MKNQLFPLAAAVLLVQAAIAGADTPPPMPAEYLGDPAEMRALARQATEDRFPDADAVTVGEFSHVVYQRDGTAVEWCDEWTKALTDKGARELAAFSTWVSLRYGDAAVERVEVYGADGSARTVDFARTLNLATDNSAMESNIYDPLDKTLSCGVPGVARGDMRRVTRCRRLLRPRVRDTWGDLSLLEDVQPVMKAVYTVDAPSDFRPVHAVLRHGVGATVKRERDRDLPGGRTLMKWTATDVPQAFLEPAMPDFYTEAQHLRLSTARDWKDISRWYWDLSLPHLEATNEAMTNKVAELTAGLAGRDERIRALFRFVSQEVRYMGITLEDTSPGYAPHDVNVTFDNRYGVCRDKAALLVAMLRIAGVDAYPVLINVGPKLDPEVPLPYFNHAIVAADAGETPPDAPPHARYTLMDPTNEASKDLFPSYLMNRSFLVAREKGEELLVSPVQDPDANGLKVDAACSLRADGSLDYRADIAFSGFADNFYRRIMLRQTPEERRRLFADVLAAAAPGAELAELALSPADLRDTETPLAVSLSAQMPGAVLRGETRDSLAVPFISGRLGLARRLLNGKTSLEKRRFPLVLPFTAANEETVTVETGDALGEPLSLPSTDGEPDLMAQLSSGVSAGCGYRFSRTFSVEKGKLVARRSERLEAVEFPPDQYFALRERLKEQETAERPLPLFAKRADASADTRILLAERDIRFTSPYDWVSTNRNVREILTYDGKKSASEFRLEYNPSWERVDIVSASVSNRNGAVHVLTPKEINEMDADWVAAAPRYPASRILVCSFPAVEIGSVVDCTFAVTAKDAPTAYEQTFILDDHDPVVRKTVTLHTPPGMKLKCAGTPFKREETPEGETLTIVSENPPRVPREPSQPPAALWRRTASVSAADWPGHARRLADALKRAADGECDLVEELVDDVCRGAAGPEARIAALREALEQRVRKAGPAPHELRYDEALGEPDTVLSDGYGSTLDRAVLFKRMLELAGFDCELALSANDRESPRELTRLAVEGAPSPRAFTVPVIKAAWRRGIWPFRSGRVFHLAEENRYTPPAASAHVGDTLFFPATGTFGSVPPGDAIDGSSPLPATVTRAVAHIRPNGAADLDFSKLVYGAKAGDLRKRYEEMLPEERRRHFRALLGAIAENATATSELETDTEGYPASVGFSAYIPGFATAGRDEITLTVPAFATAPFATGERGRESPELVPAHEASEYEYEIVFPRGFTELEFRPAEFTGAEPLAAAAADGAPAPWIEHTVSSSVEDGVMTVKLRRLSPAASAQMLPASCQPLLREWNRRLTAPAARTVTVRRAKAK